MKYFQLSKYLYHLPKSHYYRIPLYINRVAETVSESVRTMFGGVKAFRQTYSYTIPEYLELELFRRQYEAVTESELSEEELTTLRYLFDAYLLRFLPYGECQNREYQNYLVELKTDEDFEKEKAELKGTATEFPKEIPYCKDIWDWDARSVLQNGRSCNYAVPYILCLLREEVPLSDPGVLLRFQRKKTKFDSDVWRLEPPETRQQMAEIKLYEESDPLRGALGCSIFRGFLKVYMEPLLKASVKNNPVTATIGDFQGCLYKQEGTYNLQLRSKDVLFVPEELQL